MYLFIGLCHIRNESIYLLNSVHMQVLKCLEIEFEHPVFPGDFF